MYLIFDTETTGIPHNKSAPISDLDNWPRVVQLAWQLHDAKGKLLSRQNIIIQPDGFDIPYKAEQVHGISTKRAMEEGQPLKSVLELFLNDLRQTKLLVGHNIEFDISILGAEFMRQQFDVEQLLKLDKLDTGIASTEYCQLAGGIGGKLKMPRLIELHEKLFGVDFGDAHDASYDVAATARCFFGLIKKNVVNPFDSTPVEEIEYEEPNLEAANFSKREKKKEAAYSLTDSDASDSDAICSPSRAFAVLSPPGNTRHQEYGRESESAQYAGSCVDGSWQHVWCVQVRSRSQQSANQSHRRMRILHRGGKDKTEIHERQSG
jgi:DNA polymerase-3 subunit alpha